MQLFNTIRARFWHFLMFDSRGRRQIRHTMHQMYDGMNKFSDETKAHIENAIREGDVDRVDELMAEAFVELLEKGELVIVEDEQKIEVYELRIEDSLHDVVEMFGNLKHVASNARIDEQVRARVLQMLADKEAEVRGMYHKVIQEIAAEYQALFEQVSAIHEHRYIEDHWMVIRAQGFARLTRAMHEVYKISPEKRSIEHDLKHLREQEHAMKIAFERLHQEAAKNENMLRRLMTDTKRFAQTVDELVQHTLVIFEHFTHIMKVMVMYFFLEKAQEKDLDGFLETLRTQGFPESHLETLKKKKTEMEERIKSKAEQNVAVMARSRRKPQEGEQDLS